MAPPWFVRHNPKLGSLMDALPDNWLFLGFNWIIDPVTAAKLVTMLAAAKDNGAPGVSIALNSHGGSPEQALYIANIIRGFPIPIYTHNTATVQSAANLVFLAGHKRYADPKATFMFHRTVLNTGTSSMTAETLDLQATGARNSDEITLAWLRERSGQPASVFENILAGDRLHTAAEGKTLGFVDGIRELKIPANARFIQINLDGPKT